MDTGPARPQTRQRLLSDWIRGNAVALIAVFVALGGTAWAASALPKNSVGTKQLQSSAVTTKKLKNGAVNKKKVKNGAVTSSKLANGSVTEAKLSNGAVAAVKLADGSVTEGKLVNGAATGAKIADGAVTEVKLANGSVSAAKLTPGAIGAGVTLVAGEVGQSVPAEDFRALTASCPPGMKVISGGFETGEGTSGLWINESKPTGLGTSWTVGAQNETAGPQELLVYAVCI